VRSNVVSVDVDQFDPIEDGCKFRLLILGITRSRATSVQVDAALSVANRLNECSTAFQSAALIGSAAAWSNPTCSVAGSENVELDALLAATYAHRYAHRDDTCEGGVKRKIASHY
ncbi:MAG: hypothetical protein ACK5OC_02655, partial [Pirellula sp.]